MSAVATASPDGVGEAFCHEALQYSGQQGFLDGTLPFIRDAVASEEPILVVVSARKIDLLRSELAGDADRVLFADMNDVGGNPARIIPVWREFVDEHACEGRHPRGIGEPVWPGRRPAELVECTRHEALLNVAFEGSPAWWLLCPYDTATLDPTTVDTARCTHPVVRRSAVRAPSSRYRPAAVEGLGDEPLPEPSVPFRERRFGAGPLEELRRFVGRHAARAGVGTEAAEDLVLAVNEVATNSVRYGGGGGVLRLWRAEDGFVCEIRDRGRVQEPLVGRERPSTDGVRGRGVWIVNQLCDLVQLRSSPRGTVVRMHTWLP